MSDISAPVGDGKPNKPHDVALAQFLLRVATVTGRARYFDAPYDGVYTRRLGDAIAAFQGGGPDAGASGTRPSAAATVIEPRSQVWKNLVAAAPAELRSARTMADVGFVYLAMSKQALDVSVAAIRSPAHKLADSFKPKLVQLVQDFYQQSEIVLTVNDYRGWWRSFDDQLGLNSDGGPGESVHNYGYAVDIGFKGLAWVSPDGRIQSALNHSLSNNGLFISKWQAQLWDARNKIAIDKLHLFPTVKKGDLSHIQFFDDKPLDSVGSLIALMEAVGPRKMKWQSFEMTPTSYLCDLGLGGDKYLVGTAATIWDPKATIALTKADLAAALNAKLHRDSTFSVSAFLGVPFKTENPKQDLTASNISAAHIAAVKKLLKAEFQSAAESWKQWKPVQYADSTRRPVHKK